MGREPNLERVAAVIHQTQADVVGLNEVFYPRTLDGTEQPALEVLAQSLGMHFVFGPASVGQHRTIYLPMPMAMHSLAAGRSLPVLLTI